MIDYHWLKVKEDSISFYSTGIKFFTSPFHWKRGQKIQIMSLCVVIISFMTLDEPVRSLIQKMHHPIADIICDFGHWYGTGTPTLILFLACYVGGLLFRKSRFHVTGLFIGEAYVFSGLINTLLKSLIGRWRPFVEQGNLAFSPFVFGTNEHLSMPSGHVTAAFALSSVLAGMFENRLWKWMWYFFAIVTAFSRMYHDEHWLSDVICATFIGFGTGYFLLKSHKRAIIDH
jgi:membrane-associated phospholipid phosphatase